MIKYCLLLLVFLAGCAAPPARTPSVPAGAAYADWYRQAESSGKRVWRIDAQQSLITIIVRRGGRMARLGHDHVVASRTLAGLVAPDDGRADVHFRLEDMTVDEPDLRRAAGFDTELPQDAIAGTRRNMLTRVLEAERFPVVLLHAERIAHDDARLRLTITLHGVTRTLEVPTQIERRQYGLMASGTVSLLQSDFGITPLSVLGGALQVQDRIDMRFTIVAGATPG